MVEGREGEGRRKEEEEGGGEIEGKEQRKKNA